MSLLLDALKRAEQEKLAKQGERPANDEKARGTITAAPELQAVPSAAAPARATATSGKTEAEATQNVFQAKAAPVAAPQRKGSVLWAVIGGIVVVAVAAGSYVWYAVQTLRPPVAATTRIRPAPLPPPTLTNIPSQANLDAPGPRVASVNAEPNTQPNNSQPSAPPPAARAAEPNKAAGAPPADAEIVATLLRDAAARPAARPPLKLAPSREAPRVPADVAMGYESLRQGDFAAARRSYLAAIAADPANLDAHLGLATIEARSGNRNAAALHYRKALEVDPRNATAAAGLASLADYARPEALEAQLRGDLSRSPQSAALHFTLGNLYASQLRWNNAQAEFFEAHRLDPGSAEILVNLAVSLDHLGQSRLAAEFYQRALEAARGQAVQFDPAPIARRLAEIGR